MKKVIIALILILVGVYAALSILSSRDEYAAERMFYYAIKASRAVLDNPDVAPPKLLASVENGLQDVMKKYPKSDTAKRAHMALAEFYLNSKKYDKALSVLNDILEAEGKDPAVSSKAHFYKGNIYEKQNQWGKALEEYKILQDKYADTPLGLQVPLYIGRYYSKEDKKSEAEKAYNEAVLFYEKLEKNNSGKLLGYLSLNLLRQTYMEIGRYEEAGRVVEYIINNYPLQLTLAQQPKYVDLIFIEALKRPGKAIEIYKNFKQKTDNTKLQQQLQKKIEQLEAISGSKAEKQLKD